MDSSPSARAALMSLRVSIKNLKCSDTQTLFEGQRVQRWLNIERPALRKLTQLDGSAVLDDLKAPPGKAQPATSSTMMFCSGCFFGLYAARSLVQCSTLCGT